MDDRGKLLKQEPDPDDTSQTANDSDAWYKSPFFNKPVIGYYNRVTQSNLSLNQPFGQSGTAYSGRKVTPWVSALDVSNTSCSPTGPKRHSIGEQGVYSELYSPWLEGWPGKEQQGKSFLENGPDDLKRHHSADDLSGRHGNKGFQDHSNAGFLHSMDGSLSQGGPEVLKPEEYLSGLQTESYSIQYAHAPCGRYTRLVTSLLVVMGLAIVALAAALTVSVLSKKDSAETQGLQGGYPVVRASMTLRILNKNFTADMADTGSDQFYTVASPYSTELDRLFLTSPLASVYRGNKVISLGPGSIKTKAELLFLDTGLVKDSNVVQNVISSADRASQWEQTDAREMGQFVVCSDCVTVSLDFTRVRQLPPPLALDEEGPISGTGSPAKNTTSSAWQSTSYSSVTQQGGGIFESTTIATPILVMSNTTPFLNDGHFVIACDVTHAGDWSILTVEFTPDNSSTDEPMVVLVTLRRESPTVAEVANNEQSRILAFPDTSPDTVAVVVNVTSVTCADRGDYWCRLTMRGGQEFSESGRVAIQELPTVPVITEKWSSKAWDATPVYSCSAKLGYPPGKLTLSVAQGDGSNPQPISGQVTHGNGCEAASEVHVSALDQALRGNSSRLMCQVYSEHLQLLDSTLYSVFQQISLPRKLEIQTKSASVDDGLAALRCRLLNPPAWTRLTLLKMTSDGKNEEVVSLLNDGSVVWTNFYLRHRTLVTSDVSVTLVEFSIFIFSLKCSDEALYACAVQADVNMTEPQAYLSVTAKPTKPELTVPVDVIENYATPFAVTCKAKVGRPAGSLVLSVRNENEAEFRELTFNEQTTTPLSCTTEVHGTFYPPAGALSNGSSLSCHVIPHETLQDVAETTANVNVFKVLPGDMCAGLKDTNVSHPTDCRHVIVCENDVIARVKKCPDGFCFNTASGACSEPISLKLEPELSPDSVCYPDKDHLTSAHPGQCTAYIQCHRGREVIQHCPTGQLYVNATECSSDVTQSHCYRTLDTGLWLVTNSTERP